jgi:hypothetical protein
MTDALTLDDWQVLQRAANDFPALAEALSHLADGLRCNNWADVDVGVDLACTALQDLADEWLDENGNPDHSENGDDL